MDLSMHVHELPKTSNCKREGIAAADDQGLLAGEITTNGHRNTPSSLTITLLYLYQCAEQSLQICHMHIKILSSAYAYQLNLVSTAAST